MSDKPMPVFPLVGSMMTPPGCRSPSRSAASTIPRQMRSFTDPPGFTSSDLAKSLARGVSLSRRRSSITGESPTRSKMLPYTRGCAGRGGRDVCRSGWGMRDGSDDVRLAVAGSLAQTEVLTAATDISNGDVVEAALDAPGKLPKDGVGHVLTIRRLLG